MKNQQKKDIDRLYQVLSRLETELGGKQLISKCSGPQGWPVSGVLLFYELGELRTNWKKLRITWVCTHGVSGGTKSILWNRLYAHRGTEITGGGNHRGSIFRKHIGAAISRKDPRLAISSWGVGQSANAMISKNEVALEKKVSLHIGKMSVLWLAIVDEAGPASDRAYIKRNLIGLLAGKNGPQDPPSKNWLGQFSAKERIQQSGLWNLQHLNYEYSSECIDVIEKYVSITIDYHRKHS